MTSFGMGGKEFVIMERRKAKKFVLFSGFLLLLITLNIFFKVIEIPGSEIIYALVIVICGIIMMKKGGAAGSNFIKFFGLVAIIVGLAEASLLFTGMLAGYAEFGYVILGILGLILIFIGLLGSRGHADDPTFYPQLR